MNENSPPKSGDGSGDGSGNGSDNGSGDASLDPTVAPPAEDGRQFVLQKIYVKDFSFELPGAPAIFSGPADELDIQLNLRNSHAKLDNNNYEVVLHISIHAKAERQTVFLIEMAQAGLFAITGYSADDIRKLAGTYCCSTLFPYARETISSMVSKGGFPPLTLQPINFDAVYAQASEEQAPA